MRRPEPPFPDELPGGEERAVRLGHRRPGQPGELAPLYVFLASEESSYISGEVIGATGGKPLH